MDKKGVSVLSGAIFLALTIAATAVVYQASVPIIQQTADATKISNMINVMATIDEKIQSVARQGEGSQQSLSFTMDSGTLVVNESEDTVYWSYETQAPIFSPRTDVQEGNIHYGSNLDTKAQPGTYGPTPVFILENEHLKAYVKQIGSAGSPVSFNTTDILVALYQKDTAEWLNNPGFLDISLDDSPASRTASGWTILERSGYHLPYATVSAFVNSSYTPYWVNITLESGTDFLVITANL